MTSITPLVQNTNTSYRTSDQKEITFNADILKYFKNLTTETCESIESKYLLILQQIAARKKVDFSTFKEDEKKLLLTAAKTVQFKRMKALKSRLNPIVKKNLEKNAPCTTASLSCKSVTPVNNTEETKSSVLANPEFVSTNIVYTERGWDVSNLRADASSIVPLSLAPLSFNLSDISENEWAVMGTDQEEEKICPPDWQYQEDYAFAETAEELYLLILTCENQILQFSFLSAVLGNKNWQLSSRNEILNTFKEVNDKFRQFIELHGYLDQEVAEIVRVLRKRPDLKEIFDMAVYKHLLHTPLIDVSKQKAIITSLREAPAEVANTSTAPMDPEETFFRAQFKEWKIQQPTLPEGLLIPLLKSNIMIRFAWYSHTYFEGKINDQASERILNEAYTTYDKNFLSLLHEILSQDDNILKQEALLANSDTLEVIQTLVKDEILHPKYITKDLIDFVNSELVQSLINTNNYLGFIPGQA